MNSAYARAIDSARIEYSPMPETRDFSPNLNSEWHEQQEKEYFLWHKKRDENKNDEKANNNMRVLWEKGQINKQDNLIINDHHRHVRPSSYLLQWMNEYELKGNRED